MKPDASETPAPGPEAPRRRRPLPDWVAEHIRDYQESDGVVGHIWKGTPTLLLTTIGRRSGEPLTVPLTYGCWNESYLVVASRGGSRRHPDWYQNLVASPRVQLQVGPRHCTANARTATREERPFVWDIMLGVTPAYADYQSRTEREIPVVVLDPFED